MSGGSLLYVCISDAKGTVKHVVPRALARAGFGLEGDAHAGGGHRQISLLAETDIESVRATGLPVAPGSFGENLAVRGLPLADLGIGSRLRIGPDAELEITQIGKVCHAPCAIYGASGDCIMPRAGVFAVVVAAGDLAAGMAVTVRQVVPRHVIQAGVLTVSDRGAAGAAPDRTGPAVADTLTEGLAARIAWTGIVPDEVPEIVRRLEELTDRGLDLIVTAGGTGCAARDVTPEATRKVLQREAPGLAEAMRRASAEITPLALLQRGVCGIRGNSLIINLPGSPKAAVENLLGVLPVLPHAVQLLRGHTTHPDSPRDPT